MQIDLSLSLNGAKLLQALRQDDPGPILKALQLRVAQTFPATWAVLNEECPPPCVDCPFFWEEGGCGMLDIQKLQKEFGERVLIGGPPDERVFLGFIRACTPADWRAQAQLEMIEAAAQNKCHRKG